MDNADDTQLLKTWAVLAKKAKDYYVSDECRTFHLMFDICFAQPLSHQDFLLPIKYLDLLNTIMSGVKEERVRRLMRYGIQDKQILTRCKVVAESDKG